MEGWRDEWVIVVTGEGVSSLCLLSSHAPCFLVNLSWGDLRGERKRREGKEVRLNLCG
jgi:hypothetical protein